MSQSSQRSEEMPALVLRTLEFGEADLIVHLLTPRRGRVSVMAKHARKSVRRFPGSLDLFNHLEVTIHARRRGGMPLLARARLLSPFLWLRDHPVRYALACYLMELLMRLAPEEGIGPEMESIYGFALEALRALEEAPPDARTRVLLEVRALEALGLCPQLLACVRCGKPCQGPGPVGFHVADGGVVCEGCRDAGEQLMPVHLGTLRALDQGLRFPLSDLARLTFAPQALQEAQQIVARFQRYHVGLELRSEHFLSEVLRSRSA